MKCFKHKSDLFTSAFKRELWAALESAAPRAPAWNELSAQATALGGDRGEGTGKGHRLGQPERGDAWAEERG